jgi:hypothetical protein
MTANFYIRSLLIISCFFYQASAQKPPTNSPRDSAKVFFNGIKIAVNYGKKSVPGQKIFGGAVVPYYKVWRTGNGAATTFSTDADLEVDGAVVPRGTYSLYTYPTEDRCKLIINKQTGQWGTAYTPQLDLARIDMNVKKLKTRVEELKIGLEKTGSNSGALKIEWENTSFSVPFNVSKDTLVPSPRDSTVLVINNKRIVIDYGKPSVRGRKIMGGVVPYGIVWRTGANAATGFTTQSDLIIGGIKIPRGSYTLYTLPSSKQWKLIINRQTGQWGTVYNEKLDLARVTMDKVSLKKPVEKLLITLEGGSKNIGMMKLAWEKTQLSVNFQIK